MRQLLVFILVNVAILFSQFAFGQLEFDSTDSPLVRATKSKNLQEVKRLVLAGEPINVDAFSEPDALDIAILAGYKDIALYLLSKGATSRNNFYNAVQQGDVAWVKTLLEYKFFDDEAMIPAVENRNLEMVKLLVTNNFPTDFTQKRRRGLFRKYYVSPIEIAFDHGDEAIILELIKGGVPAKEAFYTAAVYNMNSLSQKIIDGASDKNSLFLECAKTDNIEMMKYILKFGVSPFLADQDNKNALLIAAENGRKEMFNYCLNNLHLPLNSKTAEGENALMLACRYNNAGLVSDLLNQITNLEEVNNEGETVLFYAEAGMSKEIFELILSKNPNLNHQRIDGKTAAMQAASAGRNDHVKRFIELGIDLNMETKSGKNLLSFVLNYYSSNVDLVKELIEKGVNVKVKSENGYDVSYYAIESGNLELLKLIKAKGGVVDGRASGNKRPSTRSKEVVLFVLENGGDPNATDNWGSTYMCMAVELNDIEFAAVLVKFGVDINVLCSHYDSPLAMAIKSDKILFVQFLVESGANLLSKTAWHDNIMELALEENNKDIIDYLRKKGAMTKEELNKREVERAREMSYLSSYLEQKNINAIEVLLKKYPEAIPGNEELKKLVILTAQNANLTLLEMCIDRFHWKLNDHLNFEQETILHIAAKGNNLSFVTLLVNKGANPLVKDAFGKMPVEYTKNKEIKKYLKDFK